MYCVLCIMLPTHRDHPYYGLFVAQFYEAACCWFGGHYRERQDEINWTNWRVYWRFWHDRCWWQSVRWRQWMMSLNDVSDEWWWCWTSIAGDSKDHGDDAEEDSGDDDWGGMNRDCEGSGDKVWRRLSRLLSEPRWLLLTAVDCRCAIYFTIQGAPKNVP